jgi:hypothetical protein
MRDYFSIADSWNSAARNERLECTRYFTEDRRVCDARCQRSSPGFFHGSADGAGSKHVVPPAVLTVAIPCVAVEFSVGERLVRTALHDMVRAVENRGTRLGVAAKRNSDHHRSGRRSANRDGTRSLPESN